MLVKAAGVYCTVCSVFSALLSRVKYEKQSLYLTGKKESPEQLGLEREKEMKEKG